MTTAPASSPPQHGERRCYLRGCRCPECAEAHRRYCKQYKLRRLRHGTTYINATPATQHLRALAARGWTQPAIARATGLGEPNIRDIATGRSRRIPRATRAAILAFQPGPDTAPDNYWIDPTGTIRRIRALAAIGHPIYRQAAAIGVGQSTLRHITAGNRQHVSRDLASALAALYGDWSRRDGGSSTARGIAAARGWHDPQYWEDTGRIDDPAFDPNFTTPKTLALGEDVHELVCEQGHTWDHVVMRLGGSVDNAQKAHRRWHAAQAGEAA